MASRALLAGAAAGAATVGIAWWLYVRASFRRLRGASSSIKLLEAQNEELRQKLEERDMRKDSTMIPTSMSSNNLQQLEEDEQREAQSDLDVKVLEAPRTLSDVAGACTVVQVRTRVDRPGLLAHLSTVLSGLDLNIARAKLSVSDKGVVNNEFWVQQETSSGFGPVLEAFSRRAMVQRLRAFEGPAAAKADAPSPDSFVRRSIHELGSAGELPAEWTRGASLLAPHPSDGGETSEPLIQALADALSVHGVAEWLGALPPVLARTFATALLPKLHRLQLAAGATIVPVFNSQGEYSTTRSTEFLVLIESELPVMCATAGEKGAAPSADPPEEVLHPTGSVLCRMSTVSGGDDRRLEWRSLSAPRGGVVAVVGRTQLRELLAETRKATVRRHANLIAGAPYFSTLSTPQLLAFCHRAVEVVKGPGENVQLVDPKVDASGQRNPRMFVVLSGSAVLTYEPPQHLTNYELPERRIPIHRIRPNDHFGAISVLLGGVGVDCEIYAGSEGCTLLRWSKDEFLQRFLKALPDLMYHSWASQSPLALAPAMPQIVTLLKPITLEELLTRSKQRDSPSSAELCVLLRGKLYEESAITVSIDEQVESEFSSRTGSENSLGVVRRTTPESSGGDLASLHRKSSGGDLLGKSAQWLSVSIANIPKKGKKLEQITMLLKDLGLDVQSGTITSKSVDVRASSEDLRARESGSTATFVVKYAGNISPTELAQDLRAKLHESLQLSTLLPGDAIVASRENMPFKGHIGGDADAVARKNTPPASGRRASEASPWSRRGEVLLGLLDLRALALMFAAPENPDRELWLRYLQARAPELLESLAEEPQPEPRKSLHKGGRRSPGASTSAPSAAAAKGWDREARGAAVAAGGVDGSQLECEVLACCREMLGGDYTEKCGLATELEEAGLNSLSAVDLALWLRDVFGVALPPSLVTEYPTARAIAARILQLQEVANQQAEAEAARGLDSAVAAAAPAAAGGRRQAARWLTALRGYMLLRWRQLIGGSQLLDGIEMRDLLIGHMLGEGMYGQVYLARHRIMPDRWYAVKRQNIGRLKAQGAKGKRQLRCLEREREVLLLLARESRGTNDRNLCVQLITHQQDAHALTLVMVAVLGGELFDLLAETGPMTLEEVRFYAACLVSALQHLHSRGIVYRDLKSENVLLSGGFTFRAAGWPVLGDLGLTQWIKHDGSSLHTFCGTPAFIAPEMAAQVGYGTAADWWSLGVLIYQCFTCATPFEGPNAWATLDNIVRGRRVHDLAAADPPVELPESAASVINALLHPDPAMRLGGQLRSNEVRIHPFFWGFDWSQMEKRTMTPPHSDRCKRRAYEATQHPSLRLPPLPAALEMQAVTTIFE